MQNMTKKIQNCWAARILCQAQIRHHSSPKGPNRSSEFPDGYRLLFKEEGMPRSGKHGGVSKFFFDKLPQLNSQWANSFKWNGKLSCFQHFDVFKCYCESNTGLYDLWIIEFSFFYKHFTLPLFGVWVANDERVLIQQYNHSLSYSDRSPELVFQNNRDKVS